MVNLVNLMWTILKLIEWTADYFTKNGVPNPRLDAELLLAHTLNKKRIDLYLAFEAAVSETDLATFKGYIQRRAKREPLQYITGVQEFYGIPIKVTPAVLIPRPETEILVEKALKTVLASVGSGVLASETPTHLDAGTPIRILDLCTGSGAIIAALASQLPEARFVGTDISKAALEIAGQNTEKWKDRVTLLRGDLFMPIAGKTFDLIISNPPYCPEVERASLQPEVRDHEPAEALFAGANGLAIIRKIIADAPKFLKPEGWLFMEIGEAQAEKVKELIKAMACYKEPEVIKDYSGIERIIAVQTK